MSFTRGDSSWMYSLLVYIQGLQNFPFLHIRPHSLHCQFAVVAIGGVVVVFRAARFFLLWLICDCSCFWVSAHTTLFVCSFHPRPGKKIRTTRIDLHSVQIPKLLPTLVNAYPPPVGRITIYLSFYRHILDCNLSRWWLTHVHNPRSYIL